MTYTSALPITEKERHADHARTMERVETKIRRRKATPSGQDYSRAPNEVERAIAARILGEREDDAA